MQSFELLIQPFLPHHQIKMKSLTYRTSYHGHKRLKAACKGRHRQRNPSRIVSNTLDRPRSSLACTKGNTIEHSFPSPSDKCSILPPLLCHKYSFDTRYLYLSFSSDILPSTLGLRRSWRNRVYI